MGIQVTSEDLCSEKQWTVCKALATFVAHRELSKVKLKQITPRTEEEKTEHSVAAERRRMRLVYADTIKDLLANCAIQDSEQLGARALLGRWGSGVPQGGTSPDRWPRARCL